MGAEEFYDVVQRIKPPGLGDGGATRPPLIAQFDPALHQDADAAALRERVLGEVVDTWIAARTFSDDQQMTLDDLRAHAVVGVDFVDANRLDERGAPEPVALREVLERLTLRLAADPDELSKPSGVGAAVLVLGRVLYQAQCPQVIREHSREDLIARRREEFQRLRESDAAARGSREDFPEDAQVHLSLLEEALKRVQEAGTDARLGAFRHRNLVKVNGRTYWLPSSVKEFDYQPEQVQLSQKILHLVKKQCDSDVLDQFTDNVDIKENQVRTSAPVWVPRTRLEVIAIMAGADAEYDMEARRNRFWACVSRWFFILAAILIGLVLWHQAMQIFWEMGAGLRAGFLHDVHTVISWIFGRGWLYGLAALFLLLVILSLWDAVFGRDPFTDPIVLKQNIHRDIDRAFNKGSL